METTITYFETPGIENTDALIGLVKERLEGSDIKYVAIASSTGASALKLNELSGIALTGIITSFSGNEPFKFYMYDRFSDITPNSSPDINDLREFYSEYETSFSSY